MAILILGGEDDEHAAHMFQHLRDREADVAMLDSRLFPARMELAYDPPGGTGWLVAGGRRLSFEEITAVYWRTYYGLLPPRLPDPAQAQIAQNDSRSLFETLLIGLHTRWVNGWDAFQSHQIKPLQLAKVASLGIAVPATLVSNDSQAVRRFVEEHRRCIFKPVQGGAHASRVSARHLDPEHLQSLAVSPVTIQEEVVGESVRVFVAGRQTLACALRTEQLDYRDDPAPVIEAVELPGQVARQCVTAARALHLLWTGIDLRRTGEGRYVFLEANPSPMFLGFERQTGLPLTECLGDLLTADTVER